MPSKRQLYKPGRQAGWDIDSRKYRDQQGNPISKADYEALSPMGGFVATASRRPMSDFLGQLERVVTRAQKGEDVTNNAVLRRTAANFNRLLAATLQPYAAGQTRPIPAETRSAMRLMDFYDRRYGDFHRHFETPVLVATGSELEIRCPDEAWRKVLQETYARVDMWTVLWRNWLGASQYGVAFPYEVWSDDNKELLQIIDLPPYYVWVGYALPMGVTLPQAQEAQSPNYALLPLNDEERWTQAMLQTHMMPMSYNRMGVGDNETLADGWNIPLSSQYLKPVRAMSYGYERYPVVPGSRAFLDLGTRMVFDETVRAILEGHMDQLWVFTIGTEKKPATPADILALQAALGGMTGERTGLFVWENGLEVQVHAPKSLDGILGADTRQAMTLQMFRSLGGNVRIETGNPLIGQRETAADEVDLSMWLRQLEFPRTYNLKWERYLRAKLAQAHGPAAVKANETTTVTWARPLIEVAQMVEKELRPLYQIGVLSRRTALERAGYSYDQELERKRAEKPDEELFTTPPTYSQTTVNPDTPPTETKTAPNGRPPAQLTAAWSDDTLRVSLLSAIADTYGELIAGNDVPKFVAELKDVLARYLPAIANASFVATGGQGELDPETAALAHTFVSQFADRFGETMQAELSTHPETTLVRYAERALSYGIEGYKLAVLNGQRLAMAAKGARAWKRIVAPTACAKCQADAALPHSINEPFMLMHPGESCSREEQSVRYYSADGSSTTHVPVPSYSNELVDMLRQILGGTHYQRRARD